MMTYLDKREGLPSEKHMKQLKKIGANITTLRVNRESVCNRIYIYIYIYLYTLKRLPPLQPTSWDPMLGCLYAWMLGCLSFCLPDVRFVPNSSSILEAFDHVWCLLQGPGAIWSPLE